MERDRYYNLSSDEVIDRLGTSLEGISDSEANVRLSSNGRNIISDSKPVSNVKKFLNQFNDLMIIILLVAALVSFILSLVKDESFFDSLFIIAIVIINAILGFFQELKADKSIEALKKMQVSSVRVKRDNKIKTINSEELVKGDLVFLEAGDRVPADARIIWDVALKVDESSLTGESVPVIKSNRIITDDSESSTKDNMLYCGTNVVYGKCQAIVCETGMNTEFGLIAKHLAESESEITPLQQRINNISKVLSIIITSIIVIMFIIGFVKGMDVIEIIFLSISLAVAAIPEGLPAVITIILSLGMSTMARKNAIVRKMASVETLGCAEVICSDKTGTITQNKMTVEEICFDNKVCSIKNVKDKNLLFEIMALNNDVERSDDSYIGEPTEIALYECCENYLDVAKFKDSCKRIHEIPFDSSRKMMSTINLVNDKIFIYTKGSFDNVINCCSYIYEDNKIVKLSSDKVRDLRKLEIKQANKAYRNLAYAYKKLDDDWEEDSNLEDELIFVGIASMIDPPRIDVKEAIDVCKKSHIKPVMITGDSLNTATIAKKIGILSRNDEAITGAMLDKMSFNELKNNINNYSVYARVSPMNKLSIVKAWQENDKVVAMTGDGVNDALALKKADIGIGMGITGTEVSKNVSDIILADDSFSTIVSAIREGRRIFDNIRNVLVYLLTGNIVEILIVFIGMLFGMEVFLPIQLLYINLITDSAPAIALSFEKEEKNIMKRDIRKKNSSFFTNFLIAKMGLSVLLKTIAIVLVYFLGLKLYGEDIAKTMAFLTIILLEIIFAFSCKNLRENVIDKNIFDNGYLNRCIILLSIFQIIVFATPLRYVFGLSILGFIQVAFCCIVTFCIFFIDEFSKKIILKFFKD